MKKNQHLKQGNRIKFTIIFIATIVFFVVSILLFSRQNINLNLQSFNSKNYNNGVFDGNASTVFSRAHVQVTIKNKKVTKIYVNTIYKINSSKKIKEIVPVLLLNAKSTNINVKKYGNVGKMICLAVQDALNKAEF